MRIWDIMRPEDMCNKHLLGEHVELHTIWSIHTRRVPATRGRVGYASHPEVKRWKGHLLALYARHAAQVTEMARRGYNHRSPLEGPSSANADRVKDNLWWPNVRESSTWPELWQSLEDQRAALVAKGCGCQLRRTP